MRISWITEGESPAVVKYGTSSGAYEFSASGTTDTYSYLWYKSGQIHDVVVGPLKPNTLYFYQCGSASAPREFRFRTPPAKLPVKFVVIGKPFYSASSNQPSIANAPPGDLGQTEWTNSTLRHIDAIDHDVLLLPGDLSYADSMQRLWDSFGRLVEPLASKRPWMVTQGNHEIEKIPVLEDRSFKAYNARWRMPFDESGSRSNLYYSFDVAGGVHVLMLGSYTDFDASSDQYRWLQDDLGRVDRGRTPWLVALIHAPWYNSNSAHQGEGDPMRDAMEDLLYKARVDVVFAGHVHAYERFFRGCVSLLVQARVSGGRADPCGPVHMTIGDGGNREGLANKFLEPKPEISIFREPSFGHGRFEVVNATHALWSWHRNEDEVQVISDSVWLHSLTSDPACKQALG
ncbi:putative purple acid phosphatase 20 [Asimina triloba]